MTLTFTDGSNTNWSTLDQDGYALNEDGYQGTAHWRRVDLSAQASKVVNGVYLVSDTDTAPGNWSAYFSDIALVSTDGTVHTIYGRETTNPTTVGNHSGGETALSSAVLHNSGRGGVPELTTTFYHGDHLGSSRLLTNHGGYPV